MSNFINKIKKDSVVKDIHDARIEAIDSEIVESSVNPVEGGAVFTALAGKQDKLTAGTNVSIDNGVISATDTTYTAGANISIDNGVISVVGQLGVDDYDDLDNKPIINQDLEAVGFTPVANTYYKHTGSAPSLSAFTTEQVLHNGDKLYFDTTKTSELASALQQSGVMDDSENSYWVKNNLDEPMIIAGEVEENSGVYAILVETDGGGDTGDYNIIYASATYHSENVGDFIEGWHHLESDDSYILNLSDSDERTVKTIVNTGNWNGVIIGTQAASEYVSGKIYFYDGEEYKAIDGSGSAGTMDYFELENAPFKKLPDPVVTPVEIGDVLSSINIDASTDLTDFDNFDPDTVDYYNSPNAEARFRPIPIVFSTTEPASPENFDYWLDNGVVKKYIGENWITYSAPTSITDGEVFKVLAEIEYHDDDPNSEYYIYSNGSIEELNESTSSEAPSDPYEGQYWLDTSSGSRDSYILKQYDGSDWQIVTTTNVGALEFLYDSTSALLFKNENIGGELYVFGGTGTQSNDDNFQIMFISGADISEDPGMAQKIFGLLRFDQFIDELGMNDIFYSTLGSNNPEFPISKGWLIPSGVYESVQGDYTVEYINSDIYALFSNNIQKASMTIVEGQYYKADDIEESKEYLSDGLTSTSMAFDITTNPDFMSLTPDTSFIACMDSPKLAIYTSGDWTELECTSVETEGSLPENPEDGEYCMVVMTLTLKQYVDASTGWVDVSYYATEPESPSEGDIWLTNAMPVYQNTLFSLTAMGMPHYMQSLWYSMEMYGTSVAGVIVLLWQSEITTYEAFTEVMSSNESQHMQVYTAEYENGHLHDGEWNTGELLDENGILTTGGRSFTVGDISHQEFLNTFVYGSYTPASVGVISKVVDGKLSPLATVADTAEKAIYIRISSSDFGFYETSSYKPFNYYGNYYGNIDDARTGSNIKLDESKDYTFELINNDPVFFASQGFAIGNVSIQNGGSYLSVSGYRINNDSDQLIYIKITEGGM